MTKPFLSSLPARRGHFLLESGCHSDLWFTLDGLFLAPKETAPLVTALAGQLRPYNVSAVCGPLLGGAFLAQALASHIGINFYFAEQVPADKVNGLFNATYKLPPELRRRIANERVALVDDCISAGSSIRATLVELDAAGASTVVVGTLMLLGDEAEGYLAARQIPLVALTRQQFNLWRPGECPLCLTKIPLENP